MSAIGVPRPGSVSTERAPIVKKVRVPVASLYVNAPCFSSTAIQNAGIARNRKPKKVKV